jgi:two-component system, NarL family, invasion response regulator UvrY
VARLKISHLGYESSSHLPDFRKRRNLYHKGMNILLADPHPEVLSALHLSINRLPGVSDVREAKSLIQMLAQCAQSCPDLILFDLDLVPPARSQTLAETINIFHRLCPQGRLVAMSNRFDVEQEALAAGASGFISKTAPPDEVLADIVRLLKNHS